MGKRKRVQGDHHTSLTSKPKEPTALSFVTDETTTVEGKKPRLVQHDISRPTVQIITGSYEKILHGVTARIALPVEQDDRQTKEAPEVEFDDTFLFNAHSSAIRCLAISPPSSSADASRSQKAILASGGSDQIINLYHISTFPPSQKGGEPSTPLPSLVGKRFIKNPRNRELGSLQHHDSSINALYFPTRSKLLSAAEDNTIAITRTRDWAVLSTIKAPNPKAHGRPSGDTAPFGGTPAGVNDFAVHPSMKLMVSVGKGEKCMRLWNLVTGKKAGVLNFERDLLQGLGEGRWGSGEGRKVEWNSLGEEFAVGFEKGAVVFGMDSKPKCRILPSPMTKIHQLRYVELLAETGQTSEYLAISTEDGRILFFSTEINNGSEMSKAGSKPDLLILEPIGQLGGIADGLMSRIKDFDILKLKTDRAPHEKLIVVAGSSDGAIRLWSLDWNQLTADHEPSKGAVSLTGSHEKTDVPRTRQMGSLLGTYETGNRITCLKAFLMSSPLENGGATPVEDGVSDLKNSMSKSDADSINNE